MQYMKSFVLFWCCIYIEKCFGALGDKGFYENLRERRSADEENVDEGHEEDHSEEEQHHEDHSQLIDSLFVHYDSSSSPTHATNEPTIVYVNLQLLSLDDINDAKMEFVIDSRMTFYWYDSRLMTPECRDEKKDCDDSFDLKKRFDELWTPDLYILNSRLARQHDQPLRNGMVYLHATGRVLLSKRLSVTLRCPMNLIHYPLDTQKCPLLICPYSLTEEELILRWSKNGVGILDHEDDGQHKFILQRPVRFGSWKLSYEGPDVSGSFSCVNATFTLKRNNGYHIGYSYSITGFIVIVSWLAFWLPVNAIPARVTLGVTTLLTLLTTANFVRTSLPPIPYVTAIDVWVGVCTLFVLLALLLFPIAHHFSTKNMEKTDQKGTKIMVHSRIDPLNLKCIKCGGNKSASNALSSKESLNVDKLCKQLFPVLFFVFNTIYWWYYLTQN